MNSLWGGFCVTDTVLLSHKEWMDHFLLRAITEKGLWPWSWHGFGVSGHFWSGCSAGAACDVLKQTQKAFPTEKSTQSNLTFITQMMVSAVQNISIITVQVRAELFLLNCFQQHVALFSLWLNYPECHLASCQQWRQWRIISVWTQRCSSTLLCPAYL